jgi:SOS-response transcriptional repressor LexA
MLTASAVMTAHGEFLLVEAAVSGLAAQTVGVLLLDPESDRLYVRFRRDWAELFYDADDVEYFEKLEDDLRVKAGELGAGALLRWMEETLSNSVRVSDRESVLVEDWERSLGRLYARHVSPRVLPFRTHLPVYSARAAAGKFGDYSEVEPEGWVEIAPGTRLSDDMFVAHVTGRSMEPKIPDGSRCIFRAHPAGSRTGRLVLVENFGEPGENRYTIKRYRRTGGKVLLEPLNPDYSAWELDPEARIRVLAEFVEVLPPTEPQP